MFRRQLPRKASNGQISAAPPFSINRPFVFGAVIRRPWARIFSTKLACFWNVPKCGRRFYGNLLSPFGVLIAPRGIQILKGARGVLWFACQCKQLGNRPINNLRSFVQEQTEIYTDDANLEIVPPPIWLLRCTNSGGSTDLANKRFSSPPTFLPIQFDMKTTNVRFFDVWVPSNMPIVVGGPTSSPLQTLVLFAERWATWRNRASVSCSLIFGYFAKRS